MEYAKTDNVYEMTEAILKRFRKFRGKNLRCASSKCRRPIKVHDLVISKMNQYRRKVYHKKCYDRLFTDI